LEYLFYDWDLNHYHMMQLLALTAMEPPSLFEADRVRDEKVLLDVMMGDHMLFWRQDGVELCWAFLTPILEGCETCGNRAEMLHPYEAGSWGPKAVKILHKDVQIRT